MKDQPTVKEINISGSYGRLHIEGYPTAKRICKITSPLSKHLAELRLHEARTPAKSPHNPIISAKVRLGLLSN